MIDVCECSPDWSGIILYIPIPPSSSVFILSKYSEANVETRRVVVYSCFDKGEDPEIPFPYGNPSKTLRVNVECILPFYFVRREENVGQLQIVTGLYTTVRAIKEHREWERLRVGLRSALPRVGDWALTMQSLLNVIHRGLERIHYSGQCSNSCYPCP